MQEYRRTAAALERPLWFREPALDGSEDTAHNGRHTAHNERPLTQGDLSWAEEQETGRSKTQASSKEARARFSAFFSSQQDRLLGIAYRVLRDREAALDVLQEVALTLYQRWDAVDHDQKIEGWLYRVTIHASCRWLRKKPLLLSSPDAERREIAQPPSQEAHLRTQQFQRFLARALETLSEQERFAYILRDLQQASGKEIAQIMGCEAGTIRGYYFTARKKLAAYIEAHAPEWLSVIGKGHGA